MLLAQNRKGPLGLGLGVAEASVWLSVLPVGH